MVARVTAASTELTGTLGQRAHSPIRVSTVTLTPMRMSHEGWYQPVCWDTVTDPLLTSSRVVIAKGDGRFAGQETWKQLQGRDRIKDGIIGTSRQPGWDQRQGRGKGKARNRERIRCKGIMALVGSARGTVVGPPHHSSCTG